MTPQKGDKVSVKIGKRFKKHEVVSCDAEGWITFKSTEGNDFLLHLTMHKNHIKIPKKKEERKQPKKRGRKKKK